MSDHWQVFKSFVLKYIESWEDQAERYPDIAEIVQEMRRVHMMGIQLERRRERLRDRINLLDQQGDYDRAVEAAGHLNDVEDRLNQIIKETSRLHGLATWTNLKQFVFDKYEALRSEGLSHLAAKSTLVENSSILTAKIVQRALNEKRVTERPLET